MAKKNLKIILCSGSPRRQEILRDLHIPFESHDSRIAENWDGAIPPRKFVRQISIEKAATCRVPDALSIGMDTVVVVGGQIFGKPENLREASRMLQALSNKMHLVITGVAVSYKGKVFTGVESTKVYFRKLNPAEIKWYVRTGEPFDKAGGYAIQGLARIFIRRIDGCYFNVVGFPIGCFQRVLRRHGLTIHDLM